MSKRSLEQLGKNLQLCFESKHGFFVGVGPGEVATRNSFRVRCMTQGI